MFSEAEFFCSNLHFPLLTETDGNEQLNISMQQLATSFDLVLKIFINAPIIIQGFEVSRFHHRSRRHHGVYYLQN